MIIDVILRLRPAITIALRVTNLPPDFVRLTDDDQRRVADNDTIRITDQGQLESDSGLIHVSDDDKIQETDS